MNTLKLKSMRVGKGYTQTDVAQKLGTTTKTYCDKENGKKEFSLREIIVLAIILDLDLQLVNQIFFDEKLTNRLINELSVTSEERKTA